MPLVNEADIETLCKMQQIYDLQAGGYLDNETPSAVTGVSSQAHFNAYGIAAKALQEQSDFSRIDVENPQHQEMFCVALRLTQGPETWGELSTDERLLLATMRDNAINYHADIRGAEEHAQFAGNVSLNLMALIASAGLASLPATVMSALVFGYTTASDFPAGTENYSGMSVAELHQVFTEEELTDPAVARRIIEGVNLDLEGQQLLVQATNPDGDNIVVNNISEELNAFNVSREKELSELEGLEEGDNDGGIPAELMSLFHNLNIIPNEALLNLIRKQPELAENLIGKLKTMLKQAHHERRLHYIQSASDASGFVAALGEFTGCRSLIVSGQTTHELCKIARIFENFPAINSLVDLVSPMALIGMCVLRIASLFRRNKGADMNTLILEALQKISEQLIEMRREIRQLAEGIHEHLDVLLVDITAQLNDLKGVMISVTVHRLNDIRNDLNFLYRYVEGSNEFTDLQRFRESVLQLSNYLRKIDVLSPQDQMSTNLSRMQSYLRDAFSPNHTGTFLLDQCTDSAGQQYRLLSAPSGRAERSDLPYVINFILMNVFSSADKVKAPNTHLWLSFLSAYLALRPFYKLHVSVYDPHMKVLKSESDKASKALKLIKTLSSEPAQLMVLRDRMTSDFSLMQVEVDNVLAEGAALPGFTFGGNPAAELEMLESQPLDLIDALVPYVSSEVMVKMPKTAALLEDQLAEWLLYAKQNQALFIHNPEQKDFAKAWTIFYVLAGDQPPLQRILEVKKGDHKRLKKSSRQSTFTDIELDYLRKYISTVYPHQFHYEHAPGKASKEFGNRYYPVIQHLSIKVLINHIEADGFKISPLLVYGMTHNLCRIKMTMYGSLCSGGQQQWKTSGGARYGLAISCIIDGREYQLTEETPTYAHWYDAKRNADQAAYRSHCEGIPQHTKINWATFHDVENKLREKIIHPIHMAHKNAVQRLHTCFSEKDSAHYHLLVTNEITIRLGELLGVSNEVLSGFAKLGSDLKSYFQSLETLILSAGGEPFTLPTFPSDFIEKTEVCWARFLNELASEDFVPHSPYLSQLETGISWLRETMGYEKLLMNDGATELTHRDRISVSSHIHSIFNCMHPDQEVKVHEVHELFCAITACP